MPLAQDQHYQFILSEVRSNKIDYIVITDLNLAAICCDGLFGTSWAILVIYAENTNCVIFNLCLLVVNAI